MLKKSSMGIVTVGLACLLCVDMVVAQPKVRAPTPKVEEVKIGFIWSLTGVMAAMGKESKTAAIIAVDDLNEAGGIKSLGGAKVKLLIADCKYKPEIAAAEAERLIGEGACVLIGNGSSPGGIAMARVAAKYNVPAVVDIALSPDVIKQGLKNLFRICSDGEMAAKSHARIMEELKDRLKPYPKTAVIIGPDSLWPRSTNEAVLKEFAGKINFLNQIYYPLGTASLSTEVTKIKALNPDMIMGVQFVPDAILLIQELKAQNFTPLAIWATDDAAQASVAFGQAVGKLSDYRLNVAGIEANRRSPLYPKINPRFRKELGYDFSYDATATYDGLRVIFDALERAGTMDGVALIEALRKTRLEEHLFISPLHLEFDERGQNKAIVSCLTQYHNGQVEVVYPYQYKTADLVWPMLKWSERK
jgi:branched-chain amino acid transport system substrate-binding protein